MVMYVLLNVDRW